MQTNGISSPTIVSLHPEFYKQEHSSISLINNSPKAITGDTPSIVEVSISPNSGSKAAPESFTEGNHLYYDNAVADKVSGSFPYRNNEQIEFVEKDITDYTEESTLIVGGFASASSYLEGSVEVEDLYKRSKIVTDNSLVSDEEASVIYFEEEKLSTDLPFQSYQFLRDLLDSTEESVRQIPLSISKNNDIISCGNSSDSTSLCGTSTNQLEVMYPVPMDQTRQDNNVSSQHTFQVHMHHLCPCSNVMYPYYPHNYRPTVLPQAPPIARPYLQHYQYTQLQVNPTYNMHLPSTMASHIPQSLGHSQTDVGFCLPPRDRRSFDCQDYEGKGKLGNVQCNPNDLGSMNQIHECFTNLTPSQVAALSTEQYIAYLVHGCITGEKIAKRNEHRPCFKNIQNLCTRTRSEVVKPNITVSNIHSQGMPWATKDFIFAFVRAINCWCILRGYLGNKDGNLGKIDREISPEFRGCYETWEKCTKQLTHYLIETFCRLDEANSPSQLSSNPSQTQANPIQPVTPLAKIKSSSPTRDVLSKKPVEISVPAAEKCVEEIGTIKSVPGILHIPHSSAQSEFVEAQNQNSESTDISPHEDSDNERRIYMKPGSYNVPTKHLSNQSNTNSPRSIEFFDTAQNVSIHQRRAAAEKSETFSSDMHWQNAKNITPEFIKHNEESSLPTAPVKDDKLDKYFEAATSQQNTRIEHWLNSNVFDSGNQDHDEYEEALHSLNIGKQRKPTNADNTSIWVQKKRLSEARAISKSYSTFRRTYAWEYKGGGLSDCAISALEKIIKELERTDFALHVNMKLSYSHDPKVLKHLDTFRDKFEDMIGHAFPTLDFRTITGDINDSIGPVVIKQRGKPRKNTEDAH